MVVDKQRRRSVLRSVALASLFAVASCGGHVDGCFGAGPCAGDFPNENLPTATVVPSQLTVAVGANATFTVDVAGLSTPSYQWYRSQGGAVQQIPGATSDAYTLVGAQRTDDGASFYVSVDGSTATGRLIVGSTVGTLTVQ